MGTNTMYVHHSGYMHMYLCAVNKEPVTWELHMHETLPKEYSFIYTMCARA